MTIMIMSATIIAILKKKTNHDDTDNQKKSSESEYDQENKDSYGSIIFLHIGMRGM